MSKDPISQERMKELLSMSSGLYLTMAGLTANPFEAQTLLGMIHLRLWLNCRIPGYETKEMIEEYGRNFIANCEQNDAQAKKEMH